MTHSCTGVHISENVIEIVCNYIVYVEQLQQMQKCSVTVAQVETDMPLLYIFKSCISQCKLLITGYQTSKAVTAKPAKVYFVT